MKGCRSTKDVRKDGVHLVAQLRDMLEIDGYELLDVEIWDPQTGERFGWHDLRTQKAERNGGK
ncbi:hypothetical protein [Stomatobaculum longum]|uniref:hypothetical protein n=1 Tax=Stomatobaculum longum TaxID=796942 RepID=UPI0028DBB213|nr:hypothetical protein [Stomatobaculum longum]